MRKYSGLRWKTMAAVFGALAVTTSATTQTQPAFEVAYVKGISGLHTAIRPNQIRRRLHGFDQSRSVDSSHQFPWRAGSSDREGPDWFGIASDSDPLD